MFGFDPKEVQGKLDEFSAELRDLKQGHTAMVVTLMEIENLCRRNSDMLTRLVGYTPGPPKEGEQ